MKVNDSESTMLINHLIASKVVTIEHGEPQFKLRASSLPFCQIDYLMTMLFPKIQQSSWGFSGDFYCDIGHTVHAVIQKHLGLLNVLYGHWKCETCGNLIKNKLGTQKCCGKDMIYEEYEMLDGELSAHCDGIVQPDESNPDIKYLLEIKTSGDRITKLKEPDYKHTVQANTYWNMRTKDMPELSGIMFLYMSRLKPDIYRTFLFKVNNKHDAFIFDSTCHKQMLRLYSKAKRMLQSGNFAKLAKPCSAYSDSKGCQWESICLHSDMSTILEGYFNASKKTK